MEKVLKSGKKVEMKELTALEEVLSYHLMGKSFDAENSIPTAILHRSVSIVLSLVKIDGEEVVTPATLDQVYAILAKFSKKDFDELAAVYRELNVVEDEPGE